MRTEAIGLARDLMRMEPEHQDWSSWTVQVTDEMQKVEFNLAFNEAI